MSYQRGCKIYWNTSVVIIVTVMTPGVMTKKQQPVANQNRTPIEHSSRSSAIMPPTSNSGEGYLSETYFEEEMQE